MRALEPLQLHLTTLEELDARTGNEVLIGADAELDDELTAWLREAYERS